MKLLEIKNTKQLDIVLDIWYNRTMKLRAAWINSESYDYAEKSFRLFTIMYLRTRRLLDIIKLSQPKKVIINWAELL